MPLTSIPGRVGMSMRLYQSFGPVRNAIYFSVEKTEEDIYH